MIRHRELIRADKQRIPNFPKHRPDPKGVEITTHIYYVNAVAPPGLEEAEV